MKQDSKTFAEYCAHHEPEIRKTWPAARDEAEQYDEDGYCTNCGEICTDCECNGKPLLD